MANSPESIDDFSQEELENLHRLAQDLDEAAEQSGVSRRSILQSAAALGVGAVAGGISAKELVNAVEAQADTTDTDGNVGLPSDRVDVFADGVDSTSLSTVDTETKKINGNPLVDRYDTFNDALADVQDGGSLLFPPGEYRRSEYGQLLIKDRAVSLIGFGGSVSGNTTSGARLIEDTGNDFVLRYTQSNTDTTIRMTIANLAFLSDSSGHLVNIDDTPHVNFRECVFDLGYNDIRGLYTTGNSFENTIRDCRFLRTGDAPVVWHNGDGGLYRILDSQVGGGTTNNPAVRFNVDSDIIVRGSSLGGGGDGTALEIDSVDGGVIQGRFENVGTAVELVGNAQGIEINNSHFTQIADYMVDFADTLQCHLYRPETVDAGSSGDHVIFRADSAHDSVTVGTQQRDISADIDAGAFRPHVEIDGKINDNQRTDINPVEGMEIYNLDDGNLNIYNGSEWILPDGTTT